MLFTYYYLLKPWYHIYNAYQGVNTNDEIQFAHITLTNKEAVTIHREINKRSLSTQRLISLDTKFKVVKQEGVYDSKFLDSKNIGKLPKN